MDCHVETFMESWPCLTGRGTRARAVNADRQENGFRVTLDDGRAVHGRRLLITTGLVDELPPIPGLRERWGRDRLHCPYCHGYEFAGQRLGVLYHSPQSGMHAQLIADWGPTLAAAGIPFVE
mgnify:CR=1 FL=1